MGFHRSLKVHIIVIILRLFQFETTLAQSGPGSSAQALDTLLQDYAFRTFIRPRTGISYDGMVPSNLTGIRISAMRLRSGSLRTRGVKSYKEFEIPTGVTVSPYVERLVLVYQDLGNWSSLYYPLPGYTYLTPILGLLAYNASNLSATNLPELDLNASGDPMTIHFTDVMSPPMGLSAKCVSMNLLGSVSMRNPTSNNACLAAETGHFAIVVESIAPSATPASPIAPRPGGVVPKNRKKSNSSRLWIIIIAAVCGLALLMLLASLGTWLGKLKRRKEMQRMEKAAEVGELLHMTSVGAAKAPAATVTRTQPILEGEYAP